MIERKWRERGEFLFRLSPVRTECKRPGRLLTMLLLSCSTRVSASSSSPFCFSSSSCSRYRRYRGAARFPAPAPLPARQAVSVLLCNEAAPAATLLLLVQRCASTAAFKPARPNELEQMSWRDEGRLEMRFLTERQFDKWKWNQILSAATAPSTWVKRL